MGTLIDTSVLIAAERGDADVEKRLVDLDDEMVEIAAITASELLHGVQRMTGVRRVRASEFVEGLLRRVPVVAFDLDVARVHAILSADLAAKGISIGAHDLQIAATAVFLGYGVATRDARSFPKIKGLDVERW